MRSLAAVALLLVLGACGAGSPLSGPPDAGRRLPVAPPPPTVEEPIVCPEDVKACADGSFVSRDPARRCVFRPCPGESK
jgi:predicted small lipoprotein YifL